MARTHDMGGNADAGPIPMGEHIMADWELRADAISKILNAKGIRRGDENRRALEDLDGDEYRALSYYERWIAGLETLLTEKGILTKQEIDEALADFEGRWGEP
jgi:nitrile hydratase